MTKIVLVGAEPDVETEEHVGLEPWGVSWTDRDGRVHSRPWHRVSEVNADPVEPFVPSVV